MLTHLAPGQLLLAAKGDVRARGNGKLTSLQVLLMKKSAIVAAVLVMQNYSYLENLTPSFPGAFRAGALDGGFLQLHAEGSVPETLGQQKLFLAEGTRKRFINAAQLQAATYTAV